MMGKYDSLHDAPRKYAALHEETGNEPVPRETAPPVELDPNYSDQGPPIEAAGPPREMVGKPGAMALGFVQGVPGAPQIVNGLSAATDAITHQQNLVDAYKAASKRQDELKNIAKEQQPEAYYAANVPANVATIYAAGAAVPARIADLFVKGAGAWGTIAPHVGRILGNTALSAAEEASEGTLDSSHISRDVGGAEALRIMAKGAFKPLAALGGGMQLPQKAMEYGLRKLGGSKIGDWLGEGVIDTESKLSSAMTKANRVNQDIKGEDLASRLARSAQRGEAELGPHGFSIDPAQFGDEMSALIDRAHQKALAEKAPEYFGKDIAFTKLGMPSREGTVVVGKQRISDEASKAADQMSEARDLAHFYRRESLDDVMSSAREKLSLANKSQDALADNARGRIAAEKLGTASATAAAFPNPIAMGVGLTAGGRGTKAAMGAIDALGEGGQKLSNMKSWAERLAARNDDIGRAAQWALSAEGDNAIARLAVLADLYPDETPK